MISKSKSMDQIQYEQLPVFKREKNGKGARGFLGNSNFFALYEHSVLMLLLLCIYPNLQSTEHLDWGVLQAMWHVSNYVSLGVLQVLQVTNISYLKGGWQEGKINWGE